MKERKPLNITALVPPVGRTWAHFWVGEFSTGTMGNFQPELTYFRVRIQNKYQKYACGWAVCTEADLLARAQEVAARPERTRFPQCFGPAGGRGFGAPIRP